MPRNFTITTPVDTLRLGPDGRGAMVFTVANSSAGPNSGMAKLVPLGETKVEWLALTDDPAREFPAGGTHQFSVGANVPAGTPAGRYTWRFDMVSARRAGEERDEGPVVGFEVQATEAKKKGVPWWVWVAAALVLVVGAVVAVLVTRGGGGPRGTAPNLVGKYVVDAIVEAQAAGYKTPLAGRSKPNVTPGTVVDQVEGEGGYIQLGVVTANGAGVFLDDSDEERLGVSAADALRKQFPLVPGMMELPDYTQVEMVSAILDLEERGLHAVVTLSPSTPDLDGKVVSQTPPAPTPVTQKSRVNLVVGTGQRGWIPPRGYGRLPKAYQTYLDHQGRRLNARIATRGKDVAPGEGR